MLKEVYPWGNEVAVKNVTGQELLDALEWSYRTANLANTNEVGGYLQIAGMKVTVNLGIESTVQQGDQGVRAHRSGEDLRCGQRPLPAGADGRRLQYV